jgi:polysaccharide deacetylase 2 family uncharacterized protein YibQ
MKGLRTGTMLGAAAVLGLGVAGYFAFSRYPEEPHHRRPLAVVLPLPADAPMEEQEHINGAAPHPFDNHPHADGTERGPNPPEGNAIWGTRGGGRLAIVIDDIGYNLRMPRKFLALGLPLTFSILPNLPFSREAAALFRAERREFLIHLPMEPFDFPNVNPGPTPLLLGMDDAAAARRTESYFAGLPGAIGASNHMGSAFTFDERRMAAVQAVVARGDRLFLNSKTSTSPAPKAIARARGYPYLERNVFLDNERDTAAIRRQLRQAIRIARQYGRAVAVGHPFRGTWRVLAEAFPTAHEHGVKLVPLSSLIPGRPRSPEVWHAGGGNGTNPCAAAGKAAPAGPAFRTAGTPARRAG